MPIPQRGAGRLWPFAAGIFLAALAMMAGAVGAQTRHAHKKGLPVGPLALSAKTNRRMYPAVGAQIVMTLVAKNTMASDLVVRFHSGQRYDFELFRGKGAGGERVWRWSREKMFAMMLSASRLAPGKSLEYMETYKPGSEGFPALTPGIYTVAATLAGVPKTDSPTPIPLTATATFRVK